MGGPSPLRHLTLRVEHDCPLAQLSRELPGADFQAWSAHRLEVVEVRCTPALWPKVEAAALHLLHPLRILRTADGEPGLNYLCSGFQQFFAHAVPQIERIVADIRKQNLQPVARMALPRTA